MNIYVLLRVFLHCLLVIINVFALMAGAWSLSGSMGNVSPGAVLVVMGSVAFMVVCVMTWAETCVPHTRLSRVRTEIAVVPILILFQLVGAAVATSNVIHSVCHDLTSCVALLVLSWIASLSLLVYYLMILAVICDHARFDPSAWEASPLDHPWFLRTPRPLPPKQIAVPLRFYTTSPTESPTADNRRPHSSWMPSPLEQGSPLEPVPSLCPPRSSAFSTRVISLFVPKWATDQGPLQRGLQPPFPVQDLPQARRWDGSRRIDAPVSPSLLTEY